MGSCIGKSKHSSGANREAANIVSGDEVLEDGQFRVSVEQLNGSHLFVCIRVTTSVNQLKASIAAETGMEIYQQDLSLAVDSGEYKKLQDETLAAKACGLVDGSVLLLVQNQNEGASPGEYNTNAQSTSDSNNTYDFSIFI